MKTQLVLILLLQTLASNLLTSAQDNPFDISCDPVTLNECSAREKAYINTIKQNFADPDFLEDEKEQLTKEIQAITKVTQKDPSQHLKLKHRRDWATKKMTLLMMIEEDANSFRGPIEL